MVEDRYRDWNRDLGRDVLSGKADLESLAAHAEKTGLDPAPRSGAQERIENLVARQLR